MEINLPFELLAFGTDMSPSARNPGLDDYRAAARARFAFAAENISEAQITAFVAFCVYIVSITASTFIDRQLQYITDTCK